ncbi:AMP-dependent synthetase [Variovorax sp. WS11]|nr:AMP-binding protein [Variovorax sp. WS11]PSL84760.1 AMP-dependent synthetase [Variovorax sp. WS11]
MKETSLAGGLLDNSLGGSVALVFEEEVWSYAEVDALANRFARHFLASGLERGDRVSFFVGNDALLVGAYFGAFRAGLVANPINTRLAPPEIAYVLQHAASRYVVVGCELLPTLQNALPLLSHQPELLVLRGSGEPLLADVSYAPTDVPLDADDGALLIYTSGTTGNPKGVLLTHSNVVSATRIVQENFGITRADRTLCVMPLFHTNALMFSHLPFLASGATVILRRRFSASRFWDECLRYGCTSASVSPSILALLMEHQDKGPAMGASGLQFIMVASAPTPVALAERFEERFGRGLLLEAYGLTESTAVTTMNPLVGRRKFGSIGKVLPPQELCIIDGEIALRGPTLTRGYFRDEENTRRAFSSGWFLTGDLGSIDAEGFVTIVGRKKEMILRGGENIAPLEVEEAALRHFAVRHAAAVGLPDPIWGEVVGLSVVCDSPVSAEEIVSFLRTQLSDFKVPEHVVFVQELPRNALGKVVRLAVRDAFAIEAK